jgi:hypothetical protein
MPDSINVDFWLGEMIFLRHAISKERILVDPRKVKAVLKWKRLVTVTEIQA